MSKTKTHEQFMMDCSDKLNPNVKIIGRYKNAKTTIHCLCKICGEDFYPMPGSLYKGSMHWECSVKLAGVERRKSHEDFLKDAFAVNPTIEILGTYVLSTIPVECKCKVCGHIWSPVASSITNGEGCPKCAGNMTISEKEFRERAKVNNKVEVVGVFVDGSTKVKCQCLKCGRDDIELYPFQIYNNVGCNDCAHKELGRKLIKSNETFVSQVEKLHPTIRLLTEYQGADKQITCECITCGHIWHPIACTLTNQNVDCPSCCMSHGERTIRDWLNKHSVDFIPQKKFEDLRGVGGKPIPYDFYLPFYNMAIEYNGGQHEFPVDHFGGQKKFEKQQEHDRRKREYAESHGMQLLEIWYYDYDNIPKILQKSLNLESVETVITA